MKVMSVWPGGWVELPDPPQEEPAYRVVTTAKSSGEVRPGGPKRCKKPPPQWLENYLETGN